MILKDRILQRYVQTSHPTAFSGRTNISRYYKIPNNDDVNNILSHNYSYTLHRQFKKPKIRNPFYVYFPREQLQCDLIEIRDLAKQNDGINYLLVGIDIFTKKAWVEPLKRKTGKETLQGLQKIINDMGTKPKSIFCDRGKEFINKDIKAYLNQKNIKIYLPNSEIKASIAERFNLTLQRLIKSYLSEYQTRRYIDELPNLLKTYNNRGHRTLKNMSPLEAEDPINLTKVQNIFNERFTKILHKGRKIKVKFKLNDIVRIKILPSKFHRGYNEQFSRELFKIIQIKRNMPVPTYIIQSLNTEEIIEGSFYNEELQKVSGDTFKVEKVLKRRTRNGQTELFVKWLDFDNRHNSWILESDITDTY